MLSKEAETGGRALFAAGALAVVLAAAPYKVFDLDRFFAPKELVLHACALALALPLLRRGRLSVERADLPLALYAALSAAGALLAPDRWLAARALAVTLSGAALFWRARAADDETRRRIAGAAAFAAVAAAAVSLAEAYGFTLSLFATHRVPGGTLGNRNFVAHLAAVCAPALALAVLRAKSRRAAAAGLAGAALLAAALVLTRSRAGLLGLAAGVAVLVHGWRRLRALLDDSARARAKALVLAAGVGALAALALPNALEWKSASPYLDTLSGIADYRRGSGHGRLIQFKRSLRVAQAHPLLGAGPGNWGVVYPKFVRDADPSIDYATGRTMNPWPSSDWVAVLSERGLLALAALLAVFVLLFLGAWRRGEGGGEDAPEGYALAAVLASAAVVGCFDAFLLLPAPAFLLWSLAGALAAPSVPVWTAELSPRAARRLARAAVIVWGAAILRSAGQVAAMSLYSGARTRAQVARAALFDPANERINARLQALAQTGK